MKYQITVIESERGWGRDSWEETFDTAEEAQARMDDINSQNAAGPSPDYYLMATNLRPVSE